MRTGQAWFGLLCSLLTTTWLPEVTHLKTMAVASIVRSTSKSGNTVVDLLLARITGENSTATTTSLFVTGRSIAADVCRGLGYTCDAALTPAANRGSDARTIHWKRTATVQINVKLACGYLRLPLLDKMGTFQRGLTLFRCRWR